MESTDHRWSDNEYREDPGDKVAVRHKMAGYGEGKICEVRGEVKWGEDNSSFEPGAVEFHRHPMGLYLFNVRKTNGAAAVPFDFLSESSITATRDSLTISKLVKSVWRSLPFFTVHLRGADQKQLQLFLDKLPDHIKGKIKREQREDERQSENSQTQLREMQRQLEEMQQREENSQRQLREMQQREENLQRQLREMRQREENSQRQLREMQQREENSQRQLREMQQREKNSQRQLTLKDRQVNELQLSFSTAQRTINELRRQEACDWVIARDEIQMTDKCLGRGGWGSVYEGMYCGCAFAVKQIHDLILSPHNIRLFEREMNIASKCRHPCLLQFIGATNDEESPLFVTELMETSLRTLLEQRQLSEAEMFVISLDVARALNYLHQKKPEPIIHRDVSSANVLLWRQSDQWRAKVSDYGTANFMQNTMTVAPGAMIYSAPEALTSSQTVQVDVYSFGVLLCEICIRELPEPSRRDEQVVLVTNQVLRGLVRQCLQTDPNNRPNMQQIIDELNEVNTTP